jgi:hypothetical protein
VTSAPIPGKQIAPTMTSAISVVNLARANLARANLANASRRVGVVAQSPMYESIHALKSNTKATSQRQVSWHVASARAHRINTEPTMFQTVYTFQPQGTISISKRSSSSLTYAPERNSTRPCSVPIPSHQGLDLALD